MDDDKPPIENFEGYSYKNSPKGSDNKHKQYWPSGSSGSIPSDHQRNTSFDDYPSRGFIIQTSDGQKNINAENIPFIISEFTTVQL